MINYACKLITQNGGWVMDYKMFSNKAICLNIEIPAAKIESLFSDVRKSEDLKITEECEKDILGLMNKLAMIENNIDVDAAGTFQITFITYEPDLRIECPAVPG